MLKGRSSGFTLIELMVVIALLAIVAFIAIPNFTTFVQNNQVQTAAEETYRTLQYARGEAVTKRVRVEVRIANDQLSVWMRNPTSGAYESVRAISLDPAKTQLRTTALTDNKLVYNVNGTATPATFTICRGTEAANGYTIDIQRSGFNQLFARGKSNVSGTAMTACTL